MNLQIEFEGQTVLVTGGTRGIGQAIASQAAESVGQIIVTGAQKRSPSQLQELFGKRQNLTYWQVDFREPGWEDQMSQLLDEHPKIDACINNAGINRISDIRQVDRKDFQDVLEVNLVAPALITSQVSSGMARQGYGRIVNVSSIWGQVSRAGRASYSSSKSGLIGQTRAASLDLASSGILVNAVCPGFVETDLTRQTLGEEGMSQASKQIPLGRLANCQEIVPSILFLASRLNTYITGQTLVVDGGYLAG